VLTSETTTINGHKYEVTKLPYSLGKSLLVRLFKTLAPSLARLVAGAPSAKDKNVLDLDLATVAPAIASVADQLAHDLSEEDLDFAVASLGEYSYVINGKDRQQLVADFIEFHFAGNYGELFQWLAFALRVNYLGFLKGRGLEALLARAQATKASQSPSG
jgi:hypothetical protein